MSAEKRLTTSSSSFSQFFESWEEQHRSYLEKLLALDHKESSITTTSITTTGIGIATTASDFGETELLIQQVLAHYQAYYDEKSKAAESDIFVMFSPPWFSSYERTLLWVTGFKPSVMFQILNESVGAEMTGEQNERIAEVKEQTRKVEREIGRAMASVQESVAGPGLCGLMKRGDQGLLDGEIEDMENAIEELKTAMVGVMRDADDLRQQTGMRLLEVLSTSQKVKFMVCTSKFWLRTRRVGMERDGRRHKIH